MPGLIPARGENVCPYCRRTARFDFLFYVRSYYRCEGCDLIFLKNPSTADNKDPIDYYRGKYHSERAHDQEACLRTTLYPRILEDIERYKKPGRILDVGCGLGLFLREARDRGWDVVGVDPSHQSIQHARELIDEAAVTGTLKDLKPDSYFDVVTSINVLDHLMTPWAETDAMRHFLKPGGLLYLRFPNGLFHRNMLRFLSFFGFRNSIQPFLVFHQYAFTTTFIRRLLSDTGFTNIRIRNAALSGADIYRSRLLLSVITGLLNRLVSLSAKSMGIASRGRVLCGPSLEVTATNP